MNETTLNCIYERAALCRAFEEECARRIESKDIKFPCYLSQGQEYIPATISVWLEDNGYTNRQIFIQHRGHSQYLSFGGDLEELVLELLGNSRGCSGGMGGSASIQSKQANIYGHDGMLGSQVPIAVGACFANRVPTICFMGDAAAEEDYVLAALGFAKTHELPILFIVEDNGLSILTEKKVRRSWEITDVAGGFGILSYEATDDPNNLYYRTPKPNMWPALINVHTTRLRWHAGAGVDDPNAFDRHKSVSGEISPSDVYATEVKLRCEQRMREVWAKHSVK